MRRSFALSLIMSLAFAANLFAVGEARMTGKVIDAETKAPIDGALVHLEATKGKTVKLDQKAKKDGSFTVFVLDGTLTYTFTITAPGYVTYQEPIKMTLGETNIREFALTKEGKPVPGAPAVGKADPAVEAYNAGAALSNSGDTAGAMAKFEEAVAAKPDLTAGWMALAKVAVKEKKYE